MISIHMSIGLYAHPSVRPSIRPPIIRPSLENAIIRHDDQIKNTIDMVHPFVSDKLKLPSNSLLCIKAESTVSICHELFGTKHYSLGTIYFLPFNNSKDKSMYRDCLQVRWLRLRNTVLSELWLGIHTQLSPSLSAYLSLWTHAMFYSLRWGV